MTTLRKQIIMAALGIPTQQSLVELDVDLDLTGNDLLLEHVRLISTAPTYLDVRDRADLGYGNLRAASFYCYGNYLFGDTAILGPMATWVPQNYHIQGVDGAAYVTVATVASSAAPCLDVPRAGDITGLAGKTLGMPTISSDVNQTTYSSVLERTYYQALNAPPTVPSAGEICCADGAIWDPLGRAPAVVPYLVFYDGAAWKAVSAP